MLHESTSHTPHKLLPRPWMVTTLRCVVCDPFSFPCGHLVPSLLARSAPLLALSFLYPAGTLLALSFLYPVGIVVPLSGGSARRRGRGVGGEECPRRWSRRSRRSDGRATLRQRRVPATGGDMVGQSKAGKATLRVPGIDSWLSRRWEEGMYIQCWICKFTYWKEKFSS
jgi:hypothetical protein